MLPNDFYPVIMTKFRRSFFSLICAVEPTSWKGFPPRNWPHVSFFVNPVSSLSGSPHFWRNILKILTKAEQKRNAYSPRCTKRKRSSTSVTWKQQMNLRKIMVIVSSPRGELFLLSVSSFRFNLNLLLEWRPPRWKLSYDAQYYRLPFRFSALAVN